MEEASYQGWEGLSPNKVTSMGPSSSTADTGRMEGFCGSKTALEDPQVQELETNSQAFCNTWNTVSGWNEQ